CLKTYVEPGDVAQPIKKVADEGFPQQKRLSAMDDQL
ncbi:unnamed protein product, partial [marine sediment metagenome]